MDNLDSVTLDMLTGDQRELAECIGLPAYIRLIRNYGGCQIYIVKPDKVAAAVRDKAIRAEYNGGNVMQLARKYGLAEQTIRTIVSPLRRMEGQTSLFPPDTADS